MKKLLLIGTLLAVVIACADQGEEEKHSRDLLNAVVWMQNSGEYDALSIQAFDLGKTRLEENLNNTEDSTKPKAIVLDIDETILDNSSFFADLILNNEELDQQNWTGWKTWTEKGEAQALPGAVEFLEYAEEKDVKIFYITNREEEEREVTLENLKNENFPSAENEHLILKTDESSKEKRQQAVADEYDIVLFFGDNLSDFSDVYYHNDEGVSAKEKVKEDAHLFGRKFIVLPNAMYGDWETTMHAAESGSDKTNAQIKIEKLRSSSKND